MGVIIEKETHPKVYNDILKEARSIIQNSDRYLVNHKLNSSKNGFCIRCSEEILNNPERPLCSSCYATWAMFFNYFYEEEYCHECGSEAETSMAFPLCSNCEKD